MLKQKALLLFLAMLAAAMAVSSHVVAAEWADSVVIGGVAEIEAVFEEGYDGARQGDIVLATVEIGMEAKLNERVSASVLLLYEEDDTPLEVDEGVITLNLTPSGRWYLAGGQMYVPFGVFESHLISDPLTSELGETRESALLVGFESGVVYGSVYVFNGDVGTEEAIEDDEDVIDQMGLNLGVALENNAMSLDLGLSYINNIADADLLSEMLAEGMVEGVDDYVSGLALHGILSIGPLTLIGEYVAADQFNDGELDFDGEGAQPVAANLEAGFGFDWQGREATLAAAYQLSEEAVALELPETRVMLGVAVEVFERTLLSIEYAYDEDYAEEDGGTGETANTLTAQLAVEF